MGILSSMFFLDDYKVCTEMNISALYGALGVFLFLNKCSSYKAVMKLVCAGFPGLHPPPLEAHHHTAAVAQCHHKCKYLGQKEKDRQQQLIRKRICTCFKAAMCHYSTTKSQIQNQFDTTLTCNQVYCVSVTATLHLVRLFLDYVTL